MSQPTLDLIVIDDNLEALAVRACLERWGVKVNLHLIGKGSDLVQLFSQPERLSPHILITCHGTSKGIVLPELAPQIAKKEPFSSVLRPSDLKGALRLNGQIVVITGCTTGTQNFAKVFLNDGARAYIAPKGYPEADSSLLFIVNFYYFLLVKNLSANHSYKRAVAIEKEQDDFLYFSKS